MVEVRIGNNTAAPYEVKVGAVVHLFSNQDDAERYAFREYYKLVNELCEQVKKENEIIWPKDWP